MKHKIRIVALGLVMLSGAVLVGMHFWNERAESHDARFVATNTNHEVTVQFSKKQAIFSGLGYEAVTLRAVSAASGTRFEDRVSGLTLWHDDGGTLTVYQNGAIIFTGIKAAPKAEPSAADTAVSEELMSATWVWQETFMSNGERIVPSTPARFTLTFAGDRIVGTTDCNNFSGSYRLEGTLLTTGPFTATKMFCGNSNERQFVSATEGQTTVLFNTEGNLVLLLAGDAGSIFFTRAAE